MPTNSAPLSLTKYHEVRLRTAALPITASGLNDEAARFAAVGLSLESAEPHNKGQWFIQIFLHV